MSGWRIRYPAPVFISKVGILADKHLFDTSIIAEESLCMFTYDK